MTDIRIYRARMIVRDTIYYWADSDNCNYELVGVDHEAVQRLRETMRLPMQAVQGVCDASLQDADEKAD